MAKNRLTEITFNELLKETQSWLQEIYQKSKKMFGKSSPFGQLLHVISALGSSIFSYREVAAKEMNILSAESPRQIQGLMRLAGHNPTRNISASGVLRLSLKLGVDPQSEIGGGRLTLFDNMLIQNKTNGLNYLIQLNEDFKTYDITPGRNIDVVIIQGKKEKALFRGTGDPNQSLNVQTRIGETPENFSVDVKVNGTSWKISGSYYDMQLEEEAVVVRTGIAGGLDVIFGNGSFGKIPRLGSEIEIGYILSSGAEGNILNSLKNDWQFIDSPVNGIGEDLDIEDLFDITTTREIDFGSNSESVEFSKNIAPYISRNFVLATPQQYISILKRLNFFAYVDAFSKFDNENIEDDKIIYLYLVPNIRNYISGGNGYFDLDESAFYLDEIEKERIVKYIKSMGIQVPGTVMQILDPYISRYVVNVFIRNFQGHDKNQIREDVLDKLSEYFLNFQRRDRIPASDLIKIVEEIPGVDSVRITFVSEVNENYHRKNKEYKTSLVQTSGLNLADLPSTTTNLPGYNPKTLKGIDKFGDIVFEKDQIPIIRGGFKDRNGSEYFQTPTTQGLGAVNIIFTGESDVDFNSGFNKNSGSPLI